MSTQNTAHGPARRGNRRNNDSPDVKLSKALSYVLRHGAQKERIPMRPDGYVRVADLFKSSRFHAFSAADIDRVTRSNEKQRFALAVLDATTDTPVAVDLGPDATPKLDDASDKTQWYIRANQGHSLQAVQVELKKLDTLEDFPAASGERCAVHGTNRGAWQKIKESGGLSRMARTHIHLAPGLYGDDHVTSGMRASASVYVYIDIPRALAAGIPFWESANGVILSEGDADGRIPAALFLKVLVRGPDGALAEEPL